MKIDAKKIEEECQRTISYLKGYSYLKKPIANAVSITTRTTLHWMQGETKKLTLSKLLYRPVQYMPLSFRRKISRKQKYSIYWKSPSIFYQQRFPFWGEIHCVKEPTPVLLTIHFSAAMKTLVIYSSLLDLPSHLHRQFARGDNEKKKTIVIQWNPALLPPQ